MTPERLALLHDATDRQSGESVLIEPRVPTGGDANARPSPDGSRSPITVVGIWVEPQVEYARRPHERVESRSHDQAASRPTVKIQEVLLPYPLAQGDRITRLKTSQRYQIATPGIDGFGRVVATLTARGAA